MHGEHRNTLWWRGWASKSKWQFSWVSQAAKWGWSSLWFDPLSRLNYHVVLFRPSVRVSVIFLSRACSVCGVGLFDGVVAEDLAKNKMVARPGVSWSSGMLAMLTEKHDAGPSFRIIFKCMMSLVLSVGGELLSVECQSRFFCHILTFNTLIIRITLID